jgi:Secretion system C-terminal sorting domain
MFFNSLSLKIQTMKSSLLFLFALWINCAQAQTTYTYADGSWTIGDSVSYHLTNWTSAGPSGPSQVWDFSALPDLGLTADSIGSPLNTPYSANFPEAQLAQGNINGWGYFVQSPDGLWSLGSADANTFVHFTDSWQFRKYPMRYETSWTDTFSGSGISSGNNFTTSGSCNDTVDAWGTLILPYGTFTDALRLHSLATYTEVYGIETHQHVWETYEWLVPSKSRALLVLHHNIDLSTGVEATYAAWLDTLYITTSVINVPSSPTTSINLLPNPASNFVRLSIASTGLNNSEIILHIRDITGKIVRTEKSGIASGSLSEKFDLTGLVKGIYFFEITNETLHAFSKLIVD